MTHGLPGSARTRGESSWPCSQDPRQESARRRTPAARCDRQSHHSGDTSLRAIRRSARERRLLAGVQTSPYTLVHRPPETTADVEMRTLATPRHPSILRQELSSFSGQIPKATRLAAYLCCVGARSFLGRGSAVAAATRNNGRKASASSSGAVPSGAHPRQRERPLPWRVFANHLESDGTAWSRRPKRSRRQPRPGQRGRPVKSAVAVSTRRVTARSRCRVRPHLPAPGVDHYEMQQLRWRPPGDHQPNQHRGHPG